MEDTPQVIIVGEPSDYTNTIITLLASQNITATIMQPSESLTGLGTYVAIMDDVLENSGIVEKLLICDDKPTPNQQQLAVLGLPMSCLTEKDFAQAVTIPERDNSFRGGSRGKGGKIKYARR